MKIFDKEDMNRKKSSIFSVSLFVFFHSFLMCLQGCSTTGSYQSALVDKSKGEITVYSSGDRRTFFSGEQNLEDLRKAESLLKEKLKNRRVDVLSLTNLAHIQVALSQLDAAEKNCLTALRHDLKNEDAKKILAEIAIRKGLHDLASIYLSSLGGTHSKDSGVLNMLGMIELARGDYSAAMALLKKAVKLDGSDLAARMNLGVLLIKHRMMGEAATQFERVLKIVPQHSEALTHLAIIKASRGDGAGAKQMLEEILDRDPTNPIAHYNLAVVLKQEDDVTDAVKHLKSVVSSGRASSNDKSQAMAMLDEMQRTKQLKADLTEDLENETDGHGVGSPDDTTKPKATSKVAKAAEATQDHGKVNGVRDVGKDSPSGNPTTINQDKVSQEPSKKEISELDSEQDLENQIK